MDLTTVGTFTSGKSARKRRQSVGAKCQWYRWPTAERPTTLDSTRARKVQPCRTDCGRRRPTLGFSTRGRCHAAEICDWRANIFPPRLLQPELDGITLLVLPRSLRTWHVGAKFSQGLEVSRCRVHADLDFSKSSVGVQLPGRRVPTLLALRTSRVVWLASVG